MFNQAKHFIGGNWITPADKQTIPVINPSTGEKIGELARGSEQDVHLAVESAQKSLDGDWGKLTPTERGQILQKMSQLILDNADELARLESLDVGKPLKQAKGDVAACARYFKYYGEAADKVFGDTIPFQQGHTVLTLREPHGVTAHIIPWNYPMQMFARSVAAALAMGNTCVVKPAEDASLSSLFLGKLSLEAGVSAGALNIITGLGTEAGAILAKHKGIHHISFTGSNAVGKFIQQAAAENTIPVTLELGGKSPQLVFADADLANTIPTLVNSIIQNAGQTCSAGSRIIIEEKIYDKVAAMIAEKFLQIKMGEGASDLDLGPVVSKKQQERIQKMIDDGKKSGLKVIAEGKIPAELPKNGSYISPTLFSEVPENHTIAQEEIFGPVLCLIKVKDEEEALRVANGTKYGLVAGIWTQDISRAHRLAKKLQAGQVFINNYGAGGGIELPFGGVKGSGHGREKGIEALLGFSALKTITIKHG